MILSVFGLFCKNNYGGIVAWVGFLSRLARVKYDAYLYKANGSLGSMYECVVHINELSVILTKHRPE